MATALGEHNDNFVRCPLEALDWRTRRYRIIEEIVEYNPDIICLQVWIYFPYIKFKKMFSL
jgi:nocturnin